MLLSDIAHIRQMTLANRTRLVGVLLTLMAGGANARLTHLVVEERQQVAPAKPGASAYEILRGHFEGELDPKDKDNRIITDIARAERQSNGKVGYSATFAIALPLDRKVTSGFLMYDVPNRGTREVA